MECKKMLISTFIFTILISIVALTKESDGDSVSAIVNGIQQQQQEQIDIKCLCTEGEECDSNSRTCRLNHTDHACYQSWSKKIDETDIQVTAGCMRNDFFFTQILCNGNQSNLYIICCTDKDFCNDRDAQSSDIRKKLLTITKPEKFPLRIMLLLISVVVLLLVFAIVFILLLINRKNSSNEPNQNRGGLLKTLCPRLNNSNSDIKIDQTPDEMSKSSSGYGFSSEKWKLLEPRTLTKQITLEERIGMGGYGCVYRGRWHGDIIAVKIFLSSEEASWGREVEIYKTPGLNHDNVLRYIAADNIDISYRIELWLATEYHENGSVYDYLMNHTITTRILTKMIYSIVSGLWILHIPIDARNGKVAFAHRDMKTKNILVKKDLSCCIADLGLAVKEVREKQNDNNERVVIDIKANHRVGTTRYMAPEILDRTLNHQSFDSYKATDIYALGLVFWEILRRCRTTPEADDADPYELPYQDILPNNPSFEQMREVVCVRKIRPLPSARWKNNPILDYIFQLCQELWTENPSCRPDIYYIKAQLRKRFESINDELLSINIESQNQGPQTV